MTQSEVNELNRLKEDKVELKNKSYWGFDKYYPSKIYQKERSPSEPWYFLCCKCGKESQVPDFKNPQTPVAVFIFAIHKDIRWTSERKELIQYGQYDYEPLVFEEFKLCPDCIGTVGGGMVESITLLMAKYTRFSYSQLILEKPDLPELQKGMGHYVTLVEIIPRSFGRYFNVQMTRFEFNEIVRELPKEMLDLHKICHRIM